MSVAEQIVAAGAWAPVDGAGEDPEVCVVVLNWNGEHDSAACLDSYLAQRAARVRILLVDNASPDGSGERLRDRYPSVSYLQTGANLGYAGGNNRGIEWALAQGAEWVLVSNNDIVADRDCVRRLLAAAVSDGRLAAVAPLILRHDDPERVWFAGGRFDRVRAIGTHEGEGATVRRVLPAADASESSIVNASFLTGCCLLLRPAALRQVGTFPEDFFAYGEDVDLCLRLRHAGWRMAWVPGARILHRVPPRGMPPTPAQIRLRDRNRRRLVHRHYPLRWRIAFACWFWPTRAIHLVRYLIEGDEARARAIVAGMRER